MSLSLIGKRIGNYDIQAKIGEGGMGMVYLGIHPQIGKRVAIKVLHEELSSKADVVGRFFTEARSVNDINHPNIVDIVDFGDSNLDGIVLKYIIMEFLDGESLAARIRREGVTMRETLHMVGQCASALSASHKKGVVHRDLKPENVYLCTRGPDRNYVKLLDFGIAKLTGEGGAAMSSKTRTGMVIGTPAYMSPEQCEGRGQIDHRSDIYALGVVMYELLTGRVPFPGDGFGEVLVAHLTREPELPSQLNANIPPEIEAIVLHCLKKDRAARFQSMDEMIAALHDPVAHYQLWGQTAAVPSGMAVASANMSTMLGGPGMPPPPSSASMWPVGSGGLPSAASTAPPMAMGSGALQLDGPPVVSGQPRVATGMAMRGSTGMAVLGDGVPLMIGGEPRPTTLSGANGEATPGGRRPRNVILGLCAAIIVSVMLTVGIKAVAKRRGGGEVTTTQGPQGPQGPKTGRDPSGQTAKTPTKGQAAELVTIQLKSTPPAAEVSRSDELDGPVGKTPLQLRVPKGAAGFEVKLRVEGYKEETRRVGTEKDQVIEVPLTRSATAVADPVPVVEDPAGTAVAFVKGKDKSKSRDKSRSRSRRDRKKPDGTELLPPIF